MEKEVVVPTTYSNEFRRVARVGVGRLPQSTVDIAENVREAVLKQFEHMTGQTAIVIPLEDDFSLPAGNVLPEPRHRICQTAESRQACEAAWRGHRAELQRSLQPHWHRCENENWCAVVPVVCGERCAGVCQLVCEGTQEEDEFQRHVETLAMLMENFLHHTDKQPADPPQPTPAVSDGDEALGAASPSTSISESWHPQVRRAAEIIQKNAKDPALSVAAVAERVGMNSTYLAHLFREQVGVRMRLYIARRRIELAKRFLGATTWQIKRVAYESGHRNPDWFCQVFRRHTGLTPGAYRRRAARDRARA